MAITGYISVGLPFGTNSENDPYFVTDPRYGLGGLRSVSGATERNDIPLARRQVGMLVYVADENEYYTLVSGISNSDWEVFQTGTAAGGSDFYGLTGITSSEYPYGLSSTGITGDRLLVATGPTNDPFRQYIRFGNAWVQTHVISGSQGSQGVQGLQGLQGLQGVEGSQGLQGLDGSQGTQGLQGAQGLQGVQGIQGLQGVQGIQGTQGVQGLQGAEGSQGLQGLDGSQGIQGLQGVQGIQGTQGLQGVQGVQGIQGTHGVQGTQGLQGAYGIVGDYVQSVNGMTGVVSLTGIGFYGLTGITSSEYPFGLSGTGTTGDRLLVATGPTNDPFRQYIRFGNAWVQTHVISGSQGSQGVQGLQGLQGLQGQTGPTGSDAPRLILIDTFETTIDPIILKESVSHSLNGESITLTYAGGFVPATGCAFVTDPSKGTGFPVYFNSLQNNTIVFDSQTITAGIGESVTLRIVVTGSGSPPTSDTYDYQISFENEMLWGLTALSNISTQNPFDVLPNSKIIDGINEEFAIGLSNDTYLFVAYPVRHGKANFSINNAAFGGIALQGYFGIPGGQTAQATNDGGFAEPYYVYRTENMLGDRFIVKLAPTQ
jgi:hypothetical protein